MDYIRERYTGSSAGYSELWQPLKHLLGCVWQVTNTSWEVFGRSLIATNTSQQMFVGSDDSVVSRPSRVVCCRDCIALCVWGLWRAVRSITF